MRLLSRHVASSTSGAVLLVLMVIVALDAIGAIYDGSGDLRNNYTFFQMLKYVGLTLPARIYENIPISALIGCLMGLGVLANNSELTVMRAAGVSVQRVVWFVLKPVLWLVLFGTLFGEYVVPHTDQLAQSHRMLLRSGVTAQEAGSGLWNREGNEFMHLNAVYPGGVLFGVTRYRFDERRQIHQVSFSERASYQGGYWLEENGVVTHFLPGKTTTESFVTRRWDTALSPDLLHLVVMPPDSLAIMSLHGYMDYLDDQGRDSKVYRLAFWEKLLQPLTITSLVLVAISFVFGPLRSVTMGYRVFAGVIVGVVFRITQDLLGPASIVFGFSPLIAVLLPALVLAIVGLLLLKKAG